MLFCFSGEPFERALLLRDLIEPSFRLFSSDSDYRSVLCEDFVMACGGCKCIDLETSWYDRFLPSTPKPDVFDANIYDSSIIEGPISKTSLASRSISLF